jgi:membrane protein
MQPDRPDVEEGTPLHSIVARGRAVYERYIQLNGRATAAAITLYGFLALFALAVLAVAIVGFLSTGNDHVAEDIVNWLGVTGSAANTVTDAVNTAQSSARVASVVGIVGLVWVGSSFAVAIATAYNIAWRVPPRVSRERLVGLGWLAGAALLVAIGGFVTAGFAALPVLVAPLVLVVSLSVNTLVWLWTSWILPSRRLPWRASLSAAIVGAVGLEILKIVGAYVVPRLVERSSALYGTLGVVFALLTWLLVLGRLVVLVSIIEVVEWERTRGTEEITVSGPALPDHDERIG